MTIKGVIKKLPGFWVARLARDQLRLRYGEPRRKLRVTAGPPPILMLESSSFCNLRCEKCAHKTSPRKRGNMDTALALELIGQAGEMGIKRVCLSMLGEPLMHPDLDKMAARAAELGLKPYLVTNAQLLTPELGSRLIESGLDQMVVSVDGWDGPSYESRQAGARMDRLMENLEAFKAARGEAKRPLLASVTVLDAGSRARLDEVRGLLAPVFDDLRLMPLTDFGTPGGEVDPRLLPGVKSWKRAACGNPFSVLSVGWDGRVTACCNDHHFLLEYGDATRRPLADIWMDDRIKEIRRKHLEGNLAGVPLCEKCTYDWANSVAFYLLRRRFKGERD